MATTTDSHVSTFYVKEAHMRDYRSLRNTKANFKFGLNIIIGNNGSGKTNFLTLLSQLSMPYFYNTYGAGCELSIWHGHIFRVSYTLPSVTSHKREFDQRIAGSNRYLLATTKAEDYVGEDELLLSSLDKVSRKAFGKDAGYYRNICVFHGIPNIALQFISDSIEITVSKSARESGGADSVIFGGLTGMRDRSNAVLLNSIIYSIRFFCENFHSQLSIENIKIAVSRIISIQLDILNSYLHICSSIKAVRQSEIFQVYENSSRDELILKGLMLEYQVENDWLPFSALSDGTKRIFYIISQIFSYAETDIEYNSIHFTTVDFSKIIFLEEPELGIHPDQLQKLLNLIREVSKKHQVIMTTHSPQVLNMLTTKELDRITICELDPKKGTQFRKLSPAKRAKAKAYMQNDSYLSDFWLYSNLEAE